MLDTTMPSLSSNQPLLSESTVEPLWLSSRRSISASMSPMKFPIGVAKLLGDD
jgi:hypothetical protein